MKSNINFILTFAILTVLASAIVSAERTEINYGYEGIINDDGSYTKTTTAVNDFNAIGFVCSTDDCSSINGTLWNGEVKHATGNQMTLIYPTILQQKGYGVFFYKEGYFPFEAKVTYAGSGGTSPANNYFTRKENCQVPINDLVISHFGNRIEVNVTLSSSVSSPVVHAGPLNYVPDSIKDLYSVDAKVTFGFDGPSDITLAREVNLPASESRRVSVNTMLDAGEYVLTVESNTNDVKCINSIPLRVNSNLLIENNRNETTLPTIAILSPEAKTYNTKNILVNLRSTNATSVLYNWNGVNVSYTNPVMITFNEGINTLTAYAVNDVTTARTSVTFNVDTASNETNDTTPPGAVSDLHADMITKSSIHWMWNNPNDSDFLRSIIYVNGVFYTKTANNFIHLEGLSSNTAYTIKINTEDFSGNINTLDVTDTRRTLSSGNNNDDDDKDDNKDKIEKRKALVDLGPRNAMNETIPAYFEEDDGKLEAKVVAKEFDLMKLLMVMLILGIILLVLLLIVLSIKRI